MNSSNRSFHEVQPIIVIGPHGVGKTTFLSHPRCAELIGMSTPRRLALRQDYSQWAGKLAKESLAIHWCCHYDLSDDLHEVLSKCQPKCVFVLVLPAAGIRIPCEAPCVDDLRLLVHHLEKQAIAFRLLDCTTFDYREINLSQAVALLGAPMIRRRGHIPDKRWF